MIGFGGFGDDSDFGELLFDVRENGNFLLGGVAPVVGGAGGFELVGGALGVLGGRGIDENFEAVVCCAGFGLREDVNSPIASESLDDFLDDEEEEETGRESVRKRFFFNFTELEPCAPFSCCCGSRPTLDRPELKLVEAIMIDEMLFFEVFIIDRTVSRPGRLSMRSVSDFPGSLFPRFSYLRMRGVSDFPGILSPRLYYLRMRCTRRFPGS